MRQQGVSTHSHSSLLWRTRHSQGYVALSFPLLRRPQYGRGYVAKSQPCHVCQKKGTQLVCGPLSCLRHYGHTCNVQPPAAPPDVQLLQIIKMRAAKCHNKATGEDKEDMASRP